MSRLQRRDRCRPRAPTRRLAESRAPRRGLCALRQRKREREGEEEGEGGRERGGKGDRGGEGEREQTLTQTEGARERQTEIQNANA